MLYKPLLMCAILTISVEFNSSLYDYELFIYDTYIYSINSPISNYIYIYKAKKQIQKLFVNIARIYPEMCLSLLQSVLQSLPQPLSSGKTYFKLFYYTPCYARYDLAKYNFLMIDRKVGILTLIVIVVQYTYSQ